MNNLFTKKGLKAVFKDAVMSPYNISRTYYNRIAQNGTGRALALPLSIYPQVIPLFAGMLAGNMIAGPVGGALCYLALLNSYAGLQTMQIYADRRETYKDEMRASFWPNVTALNKEAAPAPKP